MSRSRLRIAKIMVMAMGLAFPVMGFASLWYSQAAGLNLTVGQKNSLLIASTMPLIVACLATLALVVWSDTRSKGGGGSGWKRATELLRVVVRRAKGLLSRDGWLVLCLCELVCLILAIAFIATTKPVTKETWIAAGVLIMEGPTIIIGMELLFRGALKDQRRFIKGITHCIGG